MDKTEPTRREFCGTTCRALSVAALGGTMASLLQACGGGGASSPTGTSGSRRAPPCKG